MGHLTLVGGPTKPPFTMNSHGLAQFKLATRFGARRIVEGYAFPEDGKPRIITPWPAKELVYDFFRNGRKDETLVEAIRTASEPKQGETASEKSKRSSLLRAAKHLKELGPKLAFEDVRKRTFRTTISRLPVRVSLDFLATLRTKAGIQNVGVIFNVATELSDSPDKMRTHAQIETEIALRVLREHITLDAVWYIDLLSEKVVKRKAEPSGGVWREIETVCDDIIIAYRMLMARRSRENEKAT
jgi:hypothetical protein